jgi:hypothetical protein
MFQVDDVRNVSVTFEPFEPRDGYDPADKIIAFVNCRVETK